MILRESSEVSRCKFTDRRRFFMAKDKEEDLKIKCAICGKEFKRITAAHLKTHNMTLMEYNKLYNKEKYYIDRCVQFLDEYYITVRYRFVEAIAGRDPYTVENKPGQKGYNGLTDQHLKHHIQGRKNIAMYFPKNSSKLIGFDVDTMDFSIVQKVYNAIVAKGIPEECVAISSSGNKGYHVDVFMSELLGFYYTKRFYKAVLNATGLDEKQVEVRGAGAQAYKLPLTKHRNTKKECCFVDVEGNKLDTIEAIEGFKKVDIEIIKKAVLEHSKMTKPCLEAQRSASDEELLFEFEEMDAAVQSNEKYSITNEAKVRFCQELLKNGYHLNENRNPTILLMATYFKDVEGLCLKDTIATIDEWISSGWDKKLIDHEFEKKKEYTIKRVYSQKMTFWTSANEIIISLPEIKEVFSVETNNKLQTHALRKLYYILLLHHKAYAKDSNQWTFYMTFEQIAKAGGSSDPKGVRAQLKKLEELGKVNIVSANKFVGPKMKAPNEYFLPAFVSYVVSEPTECNFKVCDQEEKCIDCMYKALCHLVSDKERRKHLTGKEYKQVKSVICPYN